MAIIEDVLDKLAAAIGAAVYPNGTTQASVASVDVLVYPGWPVPDKLDRDIKAGRAHISVFPRPEERVTYSQPGNWSTEAINPTTGVGTSIRTLKVQEQLLQVVIWAPNPTIRAAIYRAMDSVLANTPRMLMPDGSWTGLKYRNSFTDDGDQKAGIFTKHVFYFAEYATIETMTGSVITDSTVNIGAIP